MPFNEICITDRMNARLSSRNTSCGTQSTRKLLLAAVGMPRPRAIAPVDARIDSLEMFLSAIELVSFAKDRLDAILRKTEIGANGRIKTAQTLPWLTAP